MYGRALRRAARARLHMDETQSAVGTPSRSEAAPVFAAGDLLAGRYRVVRFLAQGGMGEVYEVDDLELHDRVALKTVRAAVLDRPGILERFKREILLTRKITHPHVCRAFDLGRHGDTTFLTMELLDGETLAQRLVRTGPLHPRDALPLVRDMAAALDAAHGAGVVHRDFKSANVVLTTRGAVVTDFGLAHDTLDEPGPDAHGGVAGTPAYMAPEQAAGGEATPATDVYAFGVVLFELVTGRRPAPSSQVGAEPSPRSLVPALERRWDDVIRACLARDPARRPPPAALARRLSPPRRRGVYLAVTALVMAAGLALVASRGRAPALAPSSSSSAVVARRSVAVLDFRNLSGQPDAAWIGAGLTEMLATELGAGEALRVIPRDQVARAALELTRAEQQAPDGVATRARLRTILGADVLIYGQYVDVGGQLRVDVRIQESTAIVAGLAESGTGRELLDMVARLGTRVRARLGVAQPAGTSVERQPAAFPRNPEAMQRYAEGAAALRRFDPLAARDAFIAAIAADDRLAVAHAALAEAWWQLGYDGRAAEAARRAYERSEGLTREDRLVIEARYRSTLGATEQALEIYQTLWRFFPDNLDHGLMLARTQFVAGQGPAALETVAALRALPPPLGDSPLIDLLEAAGAAGLGDAELRLRAAAEAVRKGRVRGARLTIAAGRSEEGWARYFLGDIAAAAAAFEEQRMIASELNARSLESEALMALGLVRLQGGEPRVARALYEASLAIRREVGNQAAISEMLSELSWLEMSAGRLTVARGHADEALAIGTAIGSSHRTGWAEYYLGLAYVFAGELDAAAAYSERSRQTFERHGNLPYTAFPRMGLALVQRARGRLDEPVAELNSLLAQLEVTAQPYAAFPLQWLADIAIAHGRLDEARALVDRVQRIRRESGQRMTEPLGVLQLAEIALQAGQPAEAARLARDAGASYARFELAEGVAVALAVEARALAPEAAAPLAARALALVETSEVFDVRMVVADAAGQVATAGSAAERRAAVPVVTAALADAERHGFGGRALALRVTLGQLEAQLGKGRKRFEAARRQAEAEGYVVLARRTAR